jgi:hypothetical protein
MILTRSTLQRIGWAMILTICSALLLALTFKVNTVKSQVRLTERQILAVRQDKTLLETEFETRASQRHLAALNDVDFGFVAPSSDQYLDGPRQLAALGKASTVGAPQPIMVAVADDKQKAIQPSMVSPLTGQAMAAEAIRSEPRKTAKAAVVTSRLAQVDRSETSIRGVLREWQR